MNSLDRNGEDLVSDGAAGATLYLVATPIGNLEDMSPRAIRVLGEVALVAAEDTRAVARLFAKFAIPKPRVMSYFTGNEAERVVSIGRELSAGKDVAIVSDAGMPGISDPGERAVALALELGARVEVVPGPVAAVTALVGSGLCTRRFMFVGFPPRETGARQQLFGSLRNQTATLLFYESPERVGATLADLAEAFGDGRRVALARELTKLHEEYVRGSLAELRVRFAVTAPRGECTLVIEGAEEGSDVQLDVEAEIRALLAQGFGPKDAAARLVVKTGKPRRQLYQLALSLKRGARSSQE